MRMISFGCFPKSEHIFGSTYIHLKLSRFFLGVKVVRTGILWILALRVGINSKRWSGLASISWKEAQLLPTKMMAHFKLLLLLVPGILGQTHFSNLFSLFIRYISLTGSNNQFHEIFNNYFSFKVWMRGFGIGCWIRWARW